MKKYLIILFSIAVVISIVQFKTVDARVNNPLSSLSGAFSVSSPTFVVDSTNSRVGIGTTTPSTLLHIAKTAGNAVLSIENSGNGNSSGIDFIRQRLTGNPGVVGGAIFMPSNTANNDGIIYIQSATSNYGTGVTSALGANNGARIQVKGGQAVISFENGPVETARLSADNHLGVGTTSPFAKLSVNSLAGGTEDLFAVSTSTASFSTSTAFQITSAGQVQVKNAVPYYGTGGSTAIVCYMSDGSLGHITITSLLASGNCVKN